MYNGIFFAGIILKRKIVRQIDFYHLAEINAIVVGKFEDALLAVPEDCQLLEVAIGCGKFFVGKHSFRHDLNSRIYVLNVDSNRMVGIVDYSCNVGRMADRNVTFIKIWPAVVVVYGLAYADGFQQGAYRQQFDMAAV